MKAKSIICIVILLAGGCATSPTGRTQLTLVPEGQLNAMGAQAFAQMQEQTKTSTDPQVNAYVRCVADALTAEVGQTDLVSRWEVVVFDDAQVNAFALPGGHIGVYTGLLKVAETADQLAAVMGHEVAHVLARHGNERVSQQMATQGVLAIAGTALAKGGSENQQLLGLLGLGAQVGVLLPFSRLQESEADRIGLDMMARAGFDPRQSVSLWENMSKASGGGPPQFLSTHPSHSTRIKDLRSHIPKVLPLVDAAHAAGKRPNCRRP